MGVSKDNVWSVKVISHKAHRRRIRMVQCHSTGDGNVSSHEGTLYWRHLVNTIELVHPSAHSSPQQKRQIDRFSRVCTDECGVSPYFTMVCLFPTQNCPFPVAVMQNVVHWAHPSPAREWQLDRFSRFFQDSLVRQTDRATDSPTD